MQSKRESMFETVMNVVIGYLSGVATQLLLFPLFNIHIPLRDNLILTVYFMAISFARSYLVRRWFNARLRRLNESS